MIVDNPDIIEPQFNILKQNFASRKTYDIKFRKEQLKQLLKGLQEMKGELDDAMRKDLGWSEILNWLFQIGVLITQLKYTIANFESWCKKKSKNVSMLTFPGKAYLQQEPYGVILVMSTWNYPIYISLNQAISAIAAGNCVILKPSELVPHTSNILHKLFHSYLNSDFYRVIEGKVEVAKAITSFPFDLILFTGSTRTAKFIAQNAAKNLTPYVLELGGKSPTIVDRDANISNAAKRILSTKFYNCGQTCVAPDYVFVHNSLKEELLSEFRHTLSEFYGNDPSQSQDYSRIINQAGLDRLKKLIDTSKAQSIIGGNPIQNMPAQEEEEEKNNSNDKIKQEMEKPFLSQERYSLYLAPTILVEPELTSDVMNEEIFGPILPIQFFEDITYVINYINSKPKPLALYYYGKTNKDKVKNETSSGAFVQNDSLMHVAETDIPFGGIQNSGQGVINGKYGFKTCSHFKPILERGTMNWGLFNIRFPPFDNRKKSYLKRIPMFYNTTQNTIVKLSVSFAVAITGLIVAAVVFHLKKD